VNHFRIESKHFGGEVVVISPVENYTDHRGFFSVPYQKYELQELGLPGEFVQDIHSRSVKNVIRGLHFQYSPPMGKLMRCTRGEAFLVTVDLRENSPTYLHWLGVIATEENQTQVWAPALFARGFCALSDITEVQYKCTSTFNGRNDIAIRWDDPDIGVMWPTKNPILSDRDKNAPTIKELCGKK
jgi:dTDP-4-dehydrorhamnose 3,5-epimerase